MDKGLVLLTLDALRNEVEKWPEFGWNKLGELSVTFSNTNPEVVISKKMKLDHPLEYIVLETKV